jgi:hypothetical protein
VFRDYPSVRHGIDWHRDMLIGVLRYAQLTPMTTSTEICHLQLTVTSITRPQFGRVDNDRDQWPTTETRHNYSALQTQSELPARLDLAQEVSVDRAGRRPARQEPL